DVSVRTCWKKSSKFVFAICDPDPGATLTLGFLVAAGGSAGLLSLLATPSCRLAGVEGLEPPTPGLGDRCSSQLSYTPSAEDLSILVFAPGAAPNSGLPEFGQQKPAELADHHSMILATTPAPTVRPPSRMAKRSFSSIAIGTISDTVIDTLSPGITISVPEGSSTTPVTSVVRK